MKKFEDFINEEISDKDKYKEYAMFIHNHIYNKSKYPIKNRPRTNDYDEGYINLIIDYEKGTFSVLSDELGSKEFKDELNLISNMIDDFIKIIKTLNISENDVYFRKNGDFLKVEFELKYSYFEENSELFKSFSSINKFNL